MQILVAELKEIKMYEDNWKTLYNKDGEAVLDIHLTDEGMKAKDAELSWEKGHFDVVLDLKRIAKADFK